MSATAEELASQAEHLQSMIEFFNINGTGQKLRGHTLGMDRTRPGATLAHIKRLKEVKTEKESGDDKPAGPIFETGENRNVGDDRDTEFERF